MCTPTQEAQWAAANKYERQGLDCEPRLPEGARPMAAPPVVDVRGRVVDPRSAINLASWASAQRSFYTQYAVVGTKESLAQGIGIPVLAGQDVEAARVEWAAGVVHHLLLEASVSRSTFASLAHHGVRIVLGGGSNDEDDPGKSWLGHPEVHKDFTTGLGGGAPWFPSTGILQDEIANILAEELFHTIQYVVMQPRAVCMYHKAYRHARQAGLYSTDNSGDEVDGEPVPTVQADEYLALALQRWLGTTEMLSEFGVPGNRRGKTGRESLKAQDPRGFCLISTIFRSDDIWNPEPKRQPWLSLPNRGMDVSEVAVFCEPVLQGLGQGCPSADVQWPYLRGKAGAGI